MQARMDSTEGEPLQEIVREAFERLHQGGKISGALSEIVPVL